VRDLMAQARSMNIHTILAVTGDRSDKHPASASPRKVLPYPHGYLDSVDILAVNQTLAPRFFAGAAVNPFKYNPADLYLQYYKMVRKLATGAEFLVTHIGWDMRKLQELQWYLQMRDIGAAVIARLMLLSVDDISRIHDGLFPGVHVAKSFAAMVQRESNISPTQSLAAQLSRLGMQVAGCKLLGYSGVQIAGLRDAQTLDMALAKIRESLETYQTYQDWLAAWNEFHGFMQFDPVPNAYHVFEDLLKPGQQSYDEAECQLTNRELPVPSTADRLRAAVLPILLSERSPEFVVKATRALCYPRCETPTRLLRHCCCLSPAACPKNLVYGPCAGSQPDGTCEFGHAQCFFRRVFALASQRHDMDRLEEGISP